MAARKSERIMNLTICLLMARRFLPREQIREAVEGYHGLSDVAFERTFERDKEELRASGVPVETGSNSVLFPDEIGYRIRRSDFELPPLAFDAAETAALGLAASVWDQQRLAEEAVTAVAKLRAAGVEPDASRLGALTPRLGAREPGFEPLWQATTSRTRVVFTYREVERHVEGWTLAYRKGSWYLLGFDAARGEERLFKVSRIVGEVRLVGRPDAYEVPDVDLEARLAGLEPREPHMVVTAAIRDDGAPPLRRRGVRIGDAARAGHGTYQVPVAGVQDAAAEFAEWCEAATVLEPAEVRDAVVAHLRAVVGSRP